MKGWLVISSGQGPVECEQCVALFARYVEKEIQCSVSDFRETEHGFSSITLYGTGLEKMAGTIKWTSPSSIRRGHRRKNWFIRSEFIAETQLPEHDMRDIRVESMKASGPGGQHVNKTMSAIRIVHIPTGIAVTASEERSSHMNRKLALSKLAKALDDVRNKEKQRIHDMKYAVHNNVVRGNQDMEFTGPDFRRR